MQITRPTAALRTIQHQDPDMVRVRLENVVDQLDDLGTKLQRETQVGFYVSREWPVDVKVASRQLEFAASAMQRLGGDREALLADALRQDASNLTAFAAELATAYAAHDRFGQHHAAWADRFTQPANDAQLALQMLEQAPARP